MGDPFGAPAAGIAPMRTPPLGAFGSGVHGMGGVGVGPPGFAAGPSQPKRPSHVAEVERPWLVDGLVDFHWLLRSGPNHPSLNDEPEIKDLALRLCAPRASAFIPPFGATPFPDGWEL